MKQRNRTIKRTITTRLDLDILEWLKAGGPRYQSRINRLLREAMCGLRNSARDSYPEVWKPVGAWVNILRARATAGQTQ
jgi:hypothetical protein